MNGLALYGGIVPFGGTFLIFSDYCKPSIRLSSLMGLQVIYIFSHDPIGLERTVQLINLLSNYLLCEQYSNLNVYRPADINETLECWELALQSKNKPSAIILSRQKLSYISRDVSEINKCQRGAYVLNTTSHDNKVTLIASGSEVKIALDVQNLLKENNIESKVISMPCQELFDDQIIDYKNQLIDNALIVSLEAGDTLSWKKYTEKKILLSG